MCLKCYSFYAIILRGGSIFVRRNQNEFPNSFTALTSTNILPSTCTVWHDVTPNFTCSDENIFTHSLDYDICYDVFKIDNMYKMFCSMSNIFLSNVKLLHPGNDCNPCLSGPQNLLIMVKPGGVLKVEFTGSSLHDFETDREFMKIKSGSCIVSQMFVFCLYAIQLHILIIPIYARSF